MIIEIIIEHAEVFCRRFRKYQSYLLPKGQVFLGEKPRLQHGKC